MDRKIADVADIVAGLATEDAELQKAAIKLKDKRSREAKSRVDVEPTNAVPTKPITAQKRTKSNSSNGNAVEPAPRQKTKRPATENRWSAPTAILNTRIPPEMDQLLDDHVAKQKRQWKLERQQGRKPTKQTIVQASLELFFHTNRKKKG